MDIDPLELDQGGSTDVHGNNIYLSSTVTKILFGKQKRNLKGKDGHK